MIENDPGPVGPPIKPRALYVPPHKRKLNVADTGCTGHFYSTDDPNVTNKQPTNAPLQVHLANDDTIVSTHTATLPFPKLPAKATEAHLFPSLTDTNLISIGKLCDADCTAVFTKDKVTVTTSEVDLDPAHTVLTGTRSPETNNLWHVPHP